VSSKVSVPNGHDLTYQWELRATTQNEFLIKPTEVQIDPAAKMLTVVEDREGESAITLVIATNPDRSCGFIVSHSGFPFTDVVPQQNAINFWSKLDAESSKVEPLYDGKEVRLCKWHLKSGGANYMLVARRQEQLDGQ
jgi:hypothetical protein